MLGRHGFVWLCLVAITSGCVVGVGSSTNPGGDDGPGDPGDPSPGDPRPPAPPPSSHLAALLSPHLGDVIPGDTATVQLSFTGFYDAPQATIAVQTLADPAVLDSWTTVARARTSGTADPTGVFPFAVTAPAGLGNPARWPQGGVVRLRAIDPDGAELPVFGQDGEACLSAHPGAPWAELIARCGAGGTHAVLVSPSPTPLDGDLAALPRLLDRKGTSSIAETEAYYAATGAPATLDEFRSQYGFDPATESHAVFYNAGDLGTGREMHCTQFASGAGPGVACYVSNYGIFGTLEADALDLLIAGADSGTAVGAFAHVAMVYTPPLSAPDSVTFAVYGADGARIDQAQLDTAGDNVSVPENCLNCHGIHSSYDPAGHTVTGARFLPFDPASFRFAAGYPRVGQENSFRRLNQLISPAASNTSAGLIAGMYAASATADVEYVPPEWSGDRASTGVYRFAIATTCRSCHASADLADGSVDPGGLDFASASSFRSQGAVIGSVLCGDATARADRGMPNAEIPTLHTWTGPARAYLVDYLGIAGACAP